MRKQFSKFFFLVLLIALFPIFITSSTSATECGGVTTAILECEETAENSVFNLLQLVIEIMSGTVGILGVVGILVIGIQYLTAGGNEQKTTKAKRRLFEVIIGLIVYAVLFAALYWLNVIPQADHQTTPEEYAEWEEREKAKKNESSTPASNPKNNSSSSSNPKSNTPNKKTYMGATLESYSSLKNISADKLVNRASIIINYAQKNGWNYGNSQSKIPGNDKLISCDRLVSISLYTLGFKNQPNGGYALNNGFFGWLKKLGFKETHSKNDIKKGSVVWIKYNPNETIGIGGHVFIVSQWDKKTNKISRYDAGKMWNKSQPIITNGFPDYYKAINNDYKSNFKVFNLP